MYPKRNNDPRIVIHSTQVTIQENSVDLLLTLVNSNENIVNEFENRLKIHEISSQKRSILGRIWPASNEVSRQLLRFTVQVPISEYVMARKLLNSIFEASMKQTESY